MKAIGNLPANGMINGSLHFLLFPVWNFHLEFECIEKNQEENLSRLSTKALWIVKISKEVKLQYLIYSYAK